MSSDEEFVSASDAAVPETNINAEKEDQLAEKSEQTGEIPKGTLSHITFISAHGRYRGG